jgi:TP901 family phage tail tape measure protein
MAGFGSPNVGTIRGAIMLDIKQALAQYAALRTANMTTMGALTSMSGTLRTVGIAALGAGAGLVYMFGKAVSASADFQKKMDYFGAVTGATGAEMDAVAKKALSMGTTTQFSASQMADAFVEFGKAGVGSADILNGVADAVVNLATAADIHMEEASDIIVNTLKTFNMAASESGHLADVIAGAANASTISVTDFGVSMKYAGGSAQAAGIPFESVADAIALLGNAGIKGSTAGTSLRQIMLSLAAPTAKAKNLMLDLGITTEDGGNKFLDATGKIRPLKGVFQILQDSTANMGEAQRLAAYKTLFNSRAISAVSILTRDGAAGFDAMTTAINGVSAADVASKRIDNLAGDMTHLKNTIQTTLIEVGGPLQDVMRGIVQHVTDVITWFGNLSESTQKTTFMVMGITGVALVFIGTIALVGSAVLQFIVVIKSLLLMVSAVRMAMISLSTTLLTTPVGWVILAIVAIVAVLVILYIKVEAVRNFINAAFQKIGEAAKWLWKNALQPAFEAIWQGIQKVGEFIGWVWHNLIYPAFMAIGAGFQAAATVIGWVWNNILYPIFKAIGDVISFVWTTYMEPAFAAIGRGFSIVGGKIAEVWGRVQPYIAEFASWVRDKLMAAFVLIRDWVVAHWPQISTVIRSAVAVIVGIIHTAIPIIAGIARIIMWVWSKVKGPLSLVVASFKMMFDRIGPGIHNLIPLFETIKGKIELAFGAVEVAIGKIVGVAQVVWGIVMKIWNAVFPVIKLIGGIIEAIVLSLAAFVKIAWDTIQPVFGAIGSFFSGLWTTITSSVSMLWGFLVTSAQTAWGLIVAIWGGIVSFFTMIWTAITVAASTAWELIKTYIITPIQGAWDFLVNAWNVLTGFLSGIWNGLVGIASAAWGSVSGAITAPIQACWDFISSTWSTITGFLSGIWNAIWGAAKSFWTAITGAITGAVSSAWDTLSGLVSKIVGLFTGLVTTLYNYGLNAIKALGKGIIDGVGSAISAAQNAVNSVISAASGVLHINSPSKVFIGFGKSTMEGMMIGIQKDQHLAVQAASMAMSAISSVPVASLAASLSTSNPTMTPALGLTSTPTAGRTSNPSGGRNSGLRDIKVYMAKDKPTPEVIRQVLHQDEVLYGG